MTRPLLVLVASVAISSAAAAQQLPELYPAPELTIDRKAIVAHAQWPIRNVAVHADGSVVVAAQNSTSMGAFSATGAPLNWALKVGWGGDNDINYVERFGADRDRTWVSDGFTRQLTLIDAGGKIISAVPYPAWVYPHWGDRHTYPLFGRMSVAAVYPNGDLLVRPQSAHTLFETKGYNRSQTHLLRIEPGGAIIRDVAHFSGSDGSIILQSDQSSHVMRVPFHAPVLWAVTGDGSRVVVAAPGTTAADSGTFRVTSIGEKGDTIFSRQYPMPGVRIPRATVDSALKTVNGFGTQTAQQVRDKVAKQIPEFRSYLTGLFVGPDHSTWIIQRPVNDTSKARVALVLDERGEPVSRVNLHDSLTVFAVDKAHMWAAVRTPPALVRFTLVPTPPRAAPPPRSASASTGRE